jgi:hypothetical protein
VLGADVVVIEHPGFFLRQDNHPPRPVGKPLEHVVALLTHGAGLGGSGPTLPTPYSSRVPTLALNASLRLAYQDVPWTRPFILIKPGRSDPCSRKHAGYAASERASLASQRTPTAGRGAGRGARAPLPREPKGAAAGWAEERRRSDEGKEVRQDEEAGAAQRPLRAEGRGTDWTDERGGKEVRQERPETSGTNTANAPLALQRWRRASGAF